MFHTHPSLQHSSLTHGFFGRTGGVSEGIYAGLNCGPGSNDDPSHVTENRRRVAATFSEPLVNLCTLHQIHSAEVVTVSEPLGDVRPKADALVTRMPNLVLGILTADCAPVLFADAGAGVIGAAHAGWKGAHSGVLENTIAAMEMLGATRNNIAAVVGPCIAQQSYEVGAEFIARFSHLDRATYFISSPRAGHHQFDLPGYVLGRLEASGIGAIATLGLDTCSDEEQFFSYRRTTKRREPDYGRQISAICLKS